MVLRKNIFRRFFLIEIIVIITVKNPKLAIFNLDDFIDDCMKKKQNNKLNFIYVGQLIDIPKGFGVLLAGIKQFLEENKNRLWIHLLPPYSPEFNAIEGVWKITRKDATHNRYFPTMKRLTRAIQTRFRLFQSERWRLSGIIANFL